MLPIKRIVLVLTLLISFIGIYKTSQYFTLKGIKLLNNQILIERISLKLPYTKVKLFNLKIKLEEIKVNTLVVDITTPLQKGIDEKKSIKWKFIKSFINLSLKILRKFPFFITVKDTYITINNKVTSNFYNLKVKNGRIIIPLVQIFVTPSQEIDLLKIKFSSKRKTKLFFSIRYRNIYLKNHLYYNLTNLEIFTEGFFYKKNVKLHTLLKISNILKGFTKVFISPKYTLYIKLNSTNISNYTFVIQAFKGKKKFFAGILNINKKILWLKGKLNLCNNLILLSLSYKNNYLYASIEDRFNLIYLTFAISLLFNKLFILASDGNGGLLNINGNLNKTKILIKDFNLKNFCNFDVKKFSLRGSITKTKWNLKGTFKKFSYRKSLSLSNLKFFATFKKNILTLKFQKTIKGFFLIKGNKFWGFLNGKLTLFKNNLNIQIPLLEGLKIKNRFLVRTYFNRLTYKGLSIINTEIWSNFNGKRIKIKLDKQANGNLIIKFKPLIFKGNIEIPLKVFDKFYILNFKGNGNANNGILKLSLNSSTLKVNYKNSIFRYKLLTDTFTSTGKIMVKNFTELKFTALNNIEDNPLNINAIIPLVGKLNIKKKIVNIKTLPFCLFYGTQKISCIKNFTLFYTKGRAFITLLSLKALPVFISIKANLKRNFLTLKSLIKINKSFLNIYLSKFKTLIIKPQNIRFSLNYKGKLSDLIRNFKWSYSQKFEIFSDYTYKPLSIYLNLVLGNKKLSGFLGLLNSFNQLPIGSGYLKYSPKYGIVFNYTLNDFPLKVNIPKKVKAFLKITSYGKLKFTSSIRTFKGNLGLEGYIHILSYNLTGKKEEAKSKQRGKNFNIKYKLNIFSPEPIFVKIPNGSLALNLNGFITSKRKNINIYTDYGTLKISDRKFNIVEGFIKIADKTFLNILLSTYNPERTIFLRVYGNLPPENLKFSVYSIPPLPENELLTYLFKGSSINNNFNNLPFIKNLVQKGTLQIGDIVSTLSSSFISGINIRFIPTIDPKEGFLFGIDIEKQFSDFLSLGYHWLPSNNPKSTYLWGSTRFLFNSFLKLQKFADNTESLTIRFFKAFGEPFQ